MRVAHTVRIMRILVAGVAALFGVVTLIAGGRVLLGADPGYAVSRPLLMYNTAMGVAYLAAGIAVWRSVRAGRCAAGAIFVLNLFVLVGILLVYRGGGAVAVESLRAMTFRTVVWLVLFLTVWWCSWRASWRARKDGVGGALTIETGAEGGDVRHVRGNRRDAVGEAELSGPRSQRRQERWMDVDRSNVCSGVLSENDGRAAGAATQVEHTLHPQGVGQQPQRLAGGLAASGTLPGCVLENLE